MLTFILIVISILFSVHYLFNYNYKARLLRKVPGPKQIFIVGNALEIMISPVELFSLARKYAAKFNGVYKFYAFPHASVSVYNPEDVETICTNMRHHEKSSLYNFLKPWLREGLLLSKGLKWQHRRKILTSAFHFNVLQKYYGALEENNKRIIEALEKTNSEALDIVPVLSEYTLHTICESAMGIQLSEQATSAGKSYKDAIYDMGSIIVHRFAHIFLHPDFLFNLTPKARDQRKYVSTIHNFTKSVIKTRKIELEKDNYEKCSGIDGELKQDIDNDNDLNVYKKKRRVAMLDLLIAAEKEGLIDSAGIQEEVDTFMFEGHDTTAAGLIFCILSLANEPTIQDKIVKELDSIFGDDSRAASMDDMASMRYLECCIKESLRIYPPVPFISRTLRYPTVLSGYEIPAGSFCHIHIFDLHRCEDLYKNALKFDPDRFLPENSVGRHNYAYIPFSAGPRNCIGQKFAMMEMKSVLIAILRNFRLVPVTTISDLRFYSDIILRNDGPIYVKFVKRIKASC